MNLSDPNQTPLTPLPPEQPNSPVPVVDQSPATQNTDKQTMDAADDKEILRWDAAEYIQRDKNNTWYVWLAVATVVLMVAAYLLMKSITFMILIPIMATALVLYVKRPPAMISYTLTTKGLYINDKLHPYGSFRAFGVVQGDEEYSIRLVPRMRLAPGVSAYFPENMGEQIVDALGVRLPMIDVKLDTIDKLLQKLRI